MEFKQVLKENRLSEIVTQVKCKNGNLITNYYESAAKFRSDIEKGLLSEAEGKTGVFILRREPAFSKLFFFASSEPGLEEELPLLDYPAGVTITEIIDKNGLFSSVRGIFKRQGFTCYGALERLNKRIEAEDKTPPPEHIRQAKTEDLNYIKRFQNRLFNIYLDKHLSEEETLNIIKEKQAFVSLGENGNLTGFIIFNAKNKRSQLKYWAADKTKGQKGAGSGLLKALYEILPEGCVLEAWCRADNSFAMKIYENKGFKKDGTVCDILCRTSEEFLPPPAPLN